MANIKQDKVVHVESNPELATLTASEESIVGDVTPEIQEVPEDLRLEDDTDIDSELVTKTDMMQYVRAEADNGRFDLVTKTSDARVLMANVGYAYEKLAKGYPVSRICEDLGIGRVAWYYVLKKSEYFKELVEQAKQEHVENVKFSLTKKTEDRYIEAEHVTPSGKVVKFRKYVPADFNAIKFFLLNKASDEFKDKQEVEIKQTNITVDIIEDVEYEDVTPTEDGEK